MPPESPSPQLSSSDMSLQSGLRSQRYSRATHSLWLWQANSVSVQTLGTWGTVGLEGVREAGRRWMEGIKDDIGTARLGVGFGALCQAMWFLADSARARSTWWTHPQHTRHRICGSSLTSPHTQLTCHTHATTTSHTCRPQPGPARTKRKRRRRGLWAMPSHLALMIFLSIY